jgi:acetyl esterase/lipase
MLKIIREPTLRVPNAGVMVYPVTHRDLNKPLDSSIKFENDFLLPHQFRTIYTDAYMKDQDPYNPLISPLAAPLSELEKLPPMAVYSSEFDPLYDDGRLFAEKLMSISSRKNQDSFTKMSGLVHGFLSLGMLSADARAGIREIQNQIYKFLE